MKREIADLWVAALRSGEYDQTTGFLHVAEEVTVGEHPVGFCCLGVLCEVAIKSGLDLRTEREELGNQALHTGGVAIKYNGDQGTLPAVVAGWADMKSEDGTPEPIHQCDDEGDCDCESPFEPLTEINDEGKTFAEIANLIEEHWERL